LLRVLSLVTKVSELVSLLLSDDFSEVHLYLGILRGFGQPTAVDYFRIFTLPRLIGQIMGLVGSIIFLRLAWARKMPWGAIFRSAEFWAALVLALAGNILGSIFSGT
jgi:hypothetical protein